MNEPKRYIFNDTYLLRRPSYEGAIFSSILGNPYYGNDLTLTFIDYKLNEVMVRNHYPLVNIEFFSAPLNSITHEGRDNSNDWGRDYRISITDLHYIRKECVWMVDDISIVRIAFEFNTISCKHIQEFDFSHSRNLNMRLLWRPPGPFQNIRHWHRLDSIKEKSWDKEGF